MHIYDLGDAQWNLPRLRTLLNEILPLNQSMEDFEVAATFPSIGDRVMRLNARRLDRKPGAQELILLAIEDITEQKQFEERKDEFIARATHELKTPLTTIKGYADLLARRLTTSGDDKAVLFVTKLDAQLTRLTVFSNDLLDASKAQAGKLELDKEQFSIRELVRQVVEDVGQTVPAREIVFRGGTRQKVFADRFRISQVLTNLLSNGLKFSPPDSRVVVRTAASRDGVTVSVQDLGIGISQADQAHVFERFFQVQDPQQPKRPGMGLGLYLSAAIIEAHGGTMWVKSEPGKGSTFSFRLPR